MTISRYFQFVFPLVLVCCSLVDLYAQDELPLLQNIRLSNNVADQVVTIIFDISDTESSEVEILFKASFDAGEHFLVNTSNATGAVGFPVSVGNDRQIEWYYGDFWDNIEGKTLRLVADDHHPINIDELITQVDETRMRDMLEYISAPRSFQVNEEHLYDVRDSLASLMQHFGYDVTFQEFTHLGRTASNVIGRKPGLGDEATTFIMDAHYDAKIDAPGADDNGSGVVGFLEAMRILSPFYFDKSIEFIGFDQEEEGLLGSINYVWFGGIESWKMIKGVLNYEMIGYHSEQPNSQQVPLGFDLLFEDQYQGIADNEFRGDFIFITGNDASSELVTAFENSAEEYVPELKVVSAIVPLNGIVAPDLLRSDHAPFWFKGLPAVMITDGSEFRNHSYHTVNDILDSLNFSFMRQVTQAGLVSLIDLAGIRHATAETFIAVSGITSSSETYSLDCNLKLFPNPAHQNIKIKAVDCFEMGEKFLIHLRDIAGKLVGQSKEYRSSDHTIDLNISYLEYGTYILEIHAENGNLSRKVIVH